MNGNRLALWAARLCAATVLAAAVGCASTPPFRAAWYLVSAEAASPALAASGVYLALLNEGSRAVPLTQVIVNPMGRAESRSVGRATIDMPPHTPNQNDRDKAADICKARGDSRLACVEAVAHRYWQPGELVLVRVDEKLGPCDIPVAVRIQCGNGCETQPQTVSGSLPNYLHDAWLKRCVHPVEGNAP